MALDKAVREARRRLDRSKEYQEKGWYHSFELPDGTSIHGAMSLEHQVQRYAAFPLPADLRGKRVLDIGAWDGWFSFEAERHGAAVTAIDCVEVPGFLEIHRKLASQVDYRVPDVYQLPRAGDTWKDHGEDIPTMEFYETDELRNGLDNWVGPTVLRGRSAPAVWRAQFRNNMGTARRPAGAQATV